MKKFLFNKVLIAFGCFATCSCTKTEFLGGDENDYLPVDPSVVVKQNRYDAEFATQTAKLYTVCQQVEGDVLTLQDDEISERKSYSCNLDLCVLFTFPENVYVGTQDLLEKVGKVSQSETNSTDQKREEKGFIYHAISRDFYMAFNAGEEIVAEAKYEKAILHGQELCHAVVRAVSFDKGTSTKNVNLSGQDSIVYDITLTFKVMIVQNGLEGKQVEKTYAVDVPYKRICKIGDVKQGVRLKQATRELLSPTTERLTVVTYEEWSVSGQVNEKTETLDLPVVFEEPDLQWIKAKSKDFSTASGYMSYAGETTEKMGPSWTVKTKPFTYSSTATEIATGSHVSFHNVYTGSSCSAVYQREDLQVMFDYGSWDISEEGSQITDSRVVSYENATYTGYDYVNNITWTYRIPTETDYTTNQSVVSGNAHSQAVILLDIPKDIPESWGDIVGMGVTAVPARDVDGHYAKKAFCLRTTKGAASVVIDMGRDLFTLEELKSAYFVAKEGGFSSSYNSAFYTTNVNANGLEVGKWAPAVGKDDNGVVYSYEGRTVSKVSKTDLHMWNWRGGNYSCYIDGYTFTVDENNALTIKCGSSTLTFR